MAAASAEPPVSKGRRRHPDLLFEWVVSKGHRWRLLFFLNLSLALHVACFYAFKVVYPTTVRQRAETTKVTFLDPRNDPLVRDVISRIEDRAVFVDGSLRLPVPGASLDNDPKNEVVPIPGFATHEIELRVPPEIQFSPSMPKIFRADNVILPSQSRFLPEGGAIVRSEPSGKKYFYKPQLLPLDGLAKREIVAQPDWSKSQQAFAAAPEQVLRFLVEVDASGEIISCLPWKGVEIGFDAAMAQEIERGVKLAPGDKVSRGWLEMRW